MSSEESPFILSVIDLLDGDKRSYTIPMYQRNYAWEEGEIHQLIDDVYEYHRTPEKNRYYLGTLVVNRRRHDNRFETIDGQQRLTTLSLITSYLQKRKHAPWYKEVNLHFDSRETSNEMLKWIFNTRDVVEEDAPDLSSAFSILNGYMIIKRYMDLKLKDDEALKKFTSYFFEKVQILQVEVPDGTDENHYFEVMNNRGEQLEKHEVLKANLLAVLNGETDSDKANEACFNCIWEACANMSKDVQSAFGDADYAKLFGDHGNTFMPENFDDIKRAMGEGMELQTESFSLSTLLSDSSQLEGKAASSNPQVSDRFSTVINFQNFLLHVLRITSMSDPFPPLDDNKLIEAFETNCHLKTEAAREHVKNFAFCLLKTRYLFDRYVIRKESSAAKGESWILRYQLRTEEKKKGDKIKILVTYPPAFGDQINEEHGINRRILMLQAAFNVSFTSMTRKYWLYSALRYCFKTHTPENGVSDIGYLSHLEETAKAFIFDNYLTDEKVFDFLEIIETNHGKCQKSPDDLSENHLKDRLSFSNPLNFIFNYLDYLLWLEAINKGKEADSRVRYFEFTQRSSVEHLHPQGADEKWEDSRDLDSFGNICLISPGNNSHYSKFNSAAKYQLFESKCKDKIESIKQFRMMELIRVNDSWNKELVHKHEREMIDLLRKGPPKNPDTSTSPL